MRTLRLRQPNCLLQREEKWRKSLILKEMGQLLINTRYFIPAVLE